MAVKANRNLYCSIRSDKRDQVGNHNADGPIVAESRQGVEEGVTKETHQSIPQAQSQATELRGRNLGG